MSEFEGEMLQRVTKVETIVEVIDEKIDKALTLTETAVKAKASADSAHHRLDKIEDNLKWLWRTFAGAIILAIAAFIISGGLN